MIRLVVVDDQNLVRSGLRMLCESSGTIEVLGEASNGREAVDVVTRLLPDVVLMDLNMPVMDGITATARILAAHPAIRVVALTTFDDDDHLYPALSAGACGFLVKDAAPADLLAGIHRAAAGDSPFSPTVLRRLVGSALRRYQDQPEPATLPALTARERDVLALVASGLSNIEIADRLHLGLTTVKTHVANLLTKTGASNRVRLALMVAVRHGTGR